MIVLSLEMKMAQTSLLQVRIDTELKKAADELFADIGLDTSSVVRLFFKQAVARQEIPIPLTRPTEKKVWKGLTCFCRITHNYPPVVNLFFASPRLAVPTLWQFYVSFSSLFIFSMFSS